MPVTLVTYDCTIIYDDDEEEEGAKRFFKIDEYRVWRSLAYQKSEFRYNFVTSQNLVGVKFCSSWVVAEKISKLHSRRGLQKNHAQLQNTERGARFEVMRIWAIRGSCEASSNHVSRPTSEPSKPSKRIQAIWASRASKEAIQLLSLLASQSANQSTNELINRPTDQPTNQPTSQ